MQVAVLGFIGELKMKKSDKSIGRVLNIIKKEVQNYDVPVSDLIHIQTKDPFKVLIATILSARTLDKTTVKVLPGLFLKVKSIEDLEKIRLNELEKLIYPVGFYKTKARHLKMLPLVLMSDFGGRIPKNVDELIRLPGVGRKTANLVSSVAFEKDAITVDTHVHRITNRLGYVKTKTPLETEQVLRRNLPKKYWRGINPVLVSYGQKICRPVTPHCKDCRVFRYCNRAGVKRFK